MKSMYGRALLVLLASVYFLYCATTPTQGHFIDVVNLIFHEAGHTIFSFFGNFVHIFMGSGFQVLLPLFITLYFFYTSQILSGSVTLMWVGQNLINVSVYAGDAIAQNLPLLGGDGVIHDWNYLLSTLHILNYTPQVAGFLYALGLTTILLAIGLALYSLLSENSKS